MHIHCTYIKDKSETSGGHKGQIDIYDVADIMYYIITGNCL